MHSLMKFKALKKPTTAAVDNKAEQSAALKGPDSFVGPRGMLVDDDCIRSLPAEPNFCGGPKRCIGPYP